MVLKRADLIIATGITTREVRMSNVITTRWDITGRSVVVDELFAQRPNLRICRGIGGRSSSACVLALDSDTIGGGVLCYDRSISVETR
jgi:hypothetical protein